jgi:hypothetical protein
VRNSKKALSKTPYFWVGSFATSGFVVNSTATAASFLVAVCIHHTATAAALGAAADGIAAVVAIAADSEEAATGA